MSASSIVKLGFQTSSRRHNNDDNHINKSSDGFTIVGHRLRQPRPSLMTRKSYQHRKKLLVVSNVGLHHKHSGTMIP